MLNEPGHLEVGVHSVAVGQDDVGAVDAVPGLGLVELATGAVPALAVPGRRAAQDRPAGGAQGAVRVPGGGGLDPDDARRRARRPDDQRVAGVGDDRRAGLAGALECHPPGASERLDLVVTVELVAAEVQQHQDLGTGVGDHVGHHALIGLEDGDVGRRSLAEGGRDAVVQVGAVGVGDQPVGMSSQSAADRGGQQVGRRGLAVGAGHGEHPASLQELREGVRSEAGEHLATDRRPRALAGKARGQRYGVAQPGRCQQSHPDAAGQPGGRRGVGEVRGHGPILPTARRPPRYCPPSRVGSP